MDRGGEEAGLARSAVRAMVRGTMSAAEVIEMIKKLPPEERAEVYSFTENAKQAEQPRTIRYMSNADADCISEQVFDQHKELFRRLAQ